MFEQKTHLTIDPRSNAADRAEFGELLIAFGRRLVAGTIQMEMEPHPADNGQPTANIFSNGTLFGLDIDAHFVPAAPTESADRHAADPRAIVSARRATRELLKQMRRAGWQYDVVIYGDESTPAENDAKVLEAIFAVGDGYIRFYNATRTLMHWVHFTVGGPKGFIDMRGFAVTGSLGDFEEPIYAFLHSAWGISVIGNDENKIEAGLEAFLRSDEKFFVTGDPREFKNAVKAYLTTGALHSTENRTH
jgi:hypothetical protein